MASAPSRVFVCSLFPPLELDEEAGYWQGDIALGDETLTISLYVSAALSDETLARASSQLASLANLRELGLQAIRAEAGDQLVREFFAFHQEELPEVAPPSASLEELVSALRLVGVGIHEEDSPYRIVLDFSFGRDHSDELLAVKFSDASVVLEVCHES